MWEIESGGKRGEEETEGAMKEVREAATGLMEEKRPNWAVEDGVRKEATDRANGEKGQDRD